MSEDHKRSSRGKRAKTKRGALPATVPATLPATHEVAQATPIETAELVQAAPPRDAGVTRGPTVWPPIAFLPLTIPLAFVSGALQRLSQR